MTRLLILMYHRLAEGIADPWGMCVSPAHFREHLGVLARIADVRPLPQALFALDETGGSADLVALTLDDGYRDNLTHAAPCLRAHRTPATFFLASGYIEAAREFWWDELEGLLFEASELPTVLQIDVGGEAYTFRFTTHQRWTENDRDQHRAWYCTERPPSERHTLFLDLWRRLAVLSADQQQLLLDGLWEWRGHQRHVRHTHAVMSARDVQTLVAVDGLEAGAHTVTHPRLTTWPPDVQQAEIAGSRRAVEALAGHRISGFAYPYGVHDAATAGIVQASGFDYACATIEGLAVPGIDRFRLPRMEVRNWNGDEFGARLRSWLAA